MERLSKYLVLKKTDIVNALSDKEQIQLGALRAKILRYRQNAGKKISRDYVVVSDSLPFHGKVCEMIQNYVDNKVGEKQQNGEEHDEETKTGGAGQ